MKKTILTILLCGVMVLGMTGCGKQKNEFDIGNKSDIKISQNDVIMTIKEGILTNKSATLVLTNNNDKIKTLAEKSEWIGNDEAHYVKIQDDRDINDMKKFIDALVYFISMSLIVDDAETMKSKKENNKNE